MTDLRLSGPALAGALLDDRYRLKELIGEGGMGSVWRAVDEALERTVAVKIFSMGSTEEALAVRRESEKRLLASLNHPSLVTLFDARLSPSGRSYLVMEYIDGGTLADRIARGPVSAWDAAALAADLGEALHVVHEAGIVHRDVKPANVLLRPPLTPQHSFRAVLADFGIAYLIDTARITTPGTALGTAAYISPEQVRGQTPTPASDVYSLGLVLIEALSGERAFPQRDAAEAIAARLTMQPTIRGDWGYGWRALLTAMTALDPTARPTALEVATRGRALDAATGEPDITALDAGTGEPDITALVAASPAEPAAVGLLRTRVLVPQPSASPPLGQTAPTTALPGSHSARERIGSDDQSGAPSPVRRRLPLLISVSTILVAAVVLALFLWSGVLDAPAPAPDLPRLEEPLGTHLRDLMNEVSQ
ncbi:serine/threonine protein kinase [Microbacterium sp. zg.B48]|uniref:serine/threonine-protein kinase n=1 Tax=Microbacterium sp. zg.B48 TaxID=2969408 RepID=UPI00214AA25D|nr:serine/threonine-protein kinase [Microbacterium sp. zg.B48]MCR2763907.1 serine/threonine protein kinase [Microbacterium sp. zg.B48]